MGDAFGRRIAGDRLEALTSHAYLALIEQRRGDLPAALAAIERAKELRAALTDRTEKWWADYFLKEPLAALGNGASSER
ncbi:MAG: hypothetical protein EXS13_12005 [Planctomycetes bacterium]|nr:hypothetical protein [Planctomycetota bacterium]